MQAAALPRRCPGLRVPRPRYPPVGGQGPRAHLRVPQHKPLRPCLPSLIISRNARCCSDSRGTSARKFFGSRPFARCRPAYPRVASLTSRRTAKEEKSVRADQTVSERVAAVLARQAEALSDGTGRPLEGTFAVVTRSPDASLVS